jgi:hypothetical protein
MLDWVPKIVQPGASKLFDVPGESGPNNSVVWEVKQAQDAELTYAEMRALPGKNPNFQRAKEVKRLMVSGKTCTQIVMALRKYSERAVKGDHAALNKVRGTTLSKNR